MNDKIHPIEILGVQLVLASQGMPLAHHHIDIRPLDFLIDGALYSAGATGQGEDDVEKAMG